MSDDNSFLKQSHICMATHDAIKTQMNAEPPTTMSSDHGEMLAEPDDLKAAAEQSRNIILDLDLEGRIRWVSPSWKDVIGTAPDEVHGISINELCLSNPRCFSEATSAMQTDDSKSQTIRFEIALGSKSIYLDQRRDDGEPHEDNFEKPEDSSAGDTIVLKGQGILVHDQSDGRKDHTIWMLRPSSQPKEITIDLPEILVDSLGVGAEMLAQHLNTLAESNEDPGLQSTGTPIMCRICERGIPPWWFERHSDGCTQEYQAESDVTLAQEALTEHRPAIVKVLDALDPDSASSRISSIGNNSNSEPSALAARAEYKGFVVGPMSSVPSPEATDLMRPTSSLSTRSRDSSTSSEPGRGSTRCFAVRRPLSKIITLLVDLCDTALDISTPSIKAVMTDVGEQFRSHSPQSESRISQVIGWQSPSVATTPEERGLAALIQDTERLASDKVNTVLRHREIIEYNERIRVEFHGLVLDCIDAAIKKTSSIKAGNLSDSTSTAESEDELAPAQQAQQSLADTHQGVGGATTDLRPISRTHSSEKRQSISLLSDRLDLSGPCQPPNRLNRRPTSIMAASTRSSSPAECPTPRSHHFQARPASRSDSVGKRSSLFFESDTAESDSGMVHHTANLQTSRNALSPEVSTRSPSSCHRKRRSLRLPNAPSPHRQASPARVSATPSSPLRMPKPRGSVMLDSMTPIPSPGTSPPLSSIDSPMLPVQRHRRQSSAASSMLDLNRTSGSPRLGSVSLPPARAVPTTIKDFEIIKPISKGAFGSVYLSKKKSTGDYFAIKVLRKADMIAKNQVTNVKAERAIMMWQGESDFVAKLYWTFSSKDYLFLVMEYLSGGDCASLVKVLGSLPEDWAKKYIAEVVLGVEHLHSRGIVHRDLKPDNLLIDQKGHLKLTDFGLSRMGLIGRQKRALKDTNDPTPDLLKTNALARAASINSSRSTSFDFQGNAVQQSPATTPEMAGAFGQPSYFSLSGTCISGQHCRRKSGYRSDSGTSDTLNALLRNFSLNTDDGSTRSAPIEEETSNDDDRISPDPYALHRASSNQSQLNQALGTPPVPAPGSISAVQPPPMALFDPEDQNRRFVGTPDYLAPETIDGFGQDETSDWWSLGCILFEFLFGYPPFHGDSPDAVFASILARDIHWPSEHDCNVSLESREFMSRLMTTNPKQRLGSNENDNFASGGEEIRRHAWFNGLNWETLLEDEASFVPNLENPEDTEYFDARGATLQNFAEEMEGQDTSPNVNSNITEYPDRPHDALLRVRSQTNSVRRGLMPLHIPPHVRDSRNRRLSEPVANDDFGNFAFKNLPVLERANKDLLQKMRVEAAQKQHKSGAISGNLPANANLPSLEGSPIPPAMPNLSRSISTGKPGSELNSPSLTPSCAASPSRASQPTSPLVSFSTGQHHLSQQALQSHQSAKHHHYQQHERRKTSTATSILPLGLPHHPDSLQDSSIASQISGSLTSASSSPVKACRNSVNVSTASPEKPAFAARPQSMFLPATSRTRSQTVGSQDSDFGPRPISHHKRQSQVFEMSPSSSDNEDPRAKALLRVQRRRQSSRRLSQILLHEGPTFRPLDVLICEDHPVSRLVMERLLEKLKCRTITVSTGAEAVRFALSEVQFDIIMMEYKLPQVNGLDIARMVRETKSANSHTPIIAVTGYLQELPQTHHFDELIEKPATLEKLTDVLRRLCQWKPAPANLTAPMQPQLRIPRNHPSGLRQEAQRLDDSPASQVSGPFSRIPGLRKGSSREHSIGSSLYGGDTDSTNTEDPPLFPNRCIEDWTTGSPVDADMSKVSSKRQVSPGPMKPPPLPSHLRPPSDVRVSSPPRQGITDLSHAQLALPHLIHQNSAPPSFDIHAPRKRPSVEAIKAKREDLERQRRLNNCVESGDDEDEELGAKHTWVRSPKVRASNQKRSSRLGIEMMRTNSRGSVDESTILPDYGTPLANNASPLIDQEKRAVSSGQAKEAVGQSQNLASADSSSPAKSSGEEIAAAIQEAGLGIGTSTFAGGQSASASLVSREAQSARMQSPSVDPLHLVEPAKPQSEPLPTDGDSLKSSAVVSPTKIVENGTIETDSSDMTSNSPRLAKPVSPVPQVAIHSDQDIQAAIRTLSNSD